MTNLPVPQFFFEAKSELVEIMAAGARGLRGPGLELMPIKRDMIRLPDDLAELVLTACNLLFSAMLNFEGAQWAIARASNPIDLVSARIDAGRAEGVVHALFYGPTADLIRTAMDHAPIAFYALAQSSPQLKILDRLDRK